MSRKSFLKRDGLRNDDFPALLIPAELSMAAHSQTGRPFAAHFPSRAFHQTVDCSEVSRIVWDSGRTVRRAGQHFTQIMGHALTRRGRLLFDGGLHAIAQRERGDDYRSL